ncbi:MAG TPA: FAD binding domain-containing protein, partial [Hyphomicrobiales bacterium]
MKAPAFDYVRAASVEEAVGLLRQHGDRAKLLAGGQSLIPALNLRLMAPELLI